MNHLAVKLSLIKSLANGTWMEALLDRHQNLLNDVSAEDEVH
jgi:hypothetical protein